MSSKSLVIYIYLSSINRCSHKINLNLFCDCIYCVYALKIGRNLDLYVADYKKEISFEKRR